MDYGTLYPYGVGVDDSQFSTALDPHSRHSTNSKEDPNPLPIKRQLANELESLQVCSFLLID